MNIVLLIHLGVAVTIGCSLYCDLSRRYRDQPMLTTTRHLVVIAALSLSAKANELIAVDDALALIVGIFVWAVAIYSVAVIRCGIGRIHWSESP